MSINLKAILSKQMAEIEKVDRSRQNNKLISKFSSLREAMLMLNGEWQSLNEEMRSSQNKEMNEAAVVAKLIRTAAVCLKAACDLSCHKSAVKVAEILDFYKEPDFGYIPIVRPGDEDKRRKKT